MVLIISEMSACDVSSSAIQGLARISNWIGQSGGEKEAENTAESSGGDSVSFLPSQLWVSAWGDALVTFVTSLK